VRLRSPSARRFFVALTLDKIARPVVLSRTTGRANSL
jgi:hypothetical protein